jgi:hypothetical protein
MQSQIRVRLAAGDASVAVKRGAVNTSIACKIFLYVVLFVDGILCYLLLMTRVWNILRKD